MAAERSLKEKIVLKVFLVILLVVLASSGASYAATVTVDANNGITYVQMNYGDTLVVKQNSPSGISVDCSWHEGQGTETVTYLDAGLLPNHPFTIYCTQKQGTPIIELLSK